MDFMYIHEQILNSLLVPSQTSKAFTVPFCQQENIFQHIKNILKGASGDLQKTTVSLTANLSNLCELHPLIGNQLQIL